MQPTSKQLSETTIQPRQGLEGIDLPELWQYRQLILFFLWRDILVRYKQTMIGLAWVLLQPLATMVIFTVVFGRLAKLPSDGLPYAVFCCAGVFCWQTFASSVTTASTSLVAQRALLTKIYFPRLIFPMSSNLVGLFDFFIAVLLFLPVLAYFHVLSWRILVVPVLVPLLFIVCLGPSIILAALVGYFRDFRILIQFIIQFIMFGSPVAYSLQSVPSNWRTLYCLNPVAGIIEAMRWALIGRTDLTWPLFAMSTASAIAVLIAGSIFFKNMERELADVV